MRTIGWGSAIRWISCGGLLVGLLAGSQSTACAEDPKPAPVPAPAPPKLAPKPPAAAPAPPSGPTCTLVDQEVPRGGRLEVSGERFGQAPVVRIAGKMARILERRADRISVQVAADSDGGLVTVQAASKTAECGTLVIIGKDR